MAEDEASLNLADETCVNEKEAEKKKEKERVDWYSLKFGNNFIIMVLVHIEKAWFRHLYTN